MIPKPGREVLVRAGGREGERIGKRLGRRVRKEGKEEGREGSLITYTWKGGASGPTRAEWSSPINAKGK